MTNFFQGYVYQGSRSSTTNAPTTSPPDNGVSRCVRELPNGYPSGQPGLVEARADQYRVATTGQVEYLTWAANTSSLATVEDPSWSVTSGTVSIPQGTLTVLDPSSPTGVRTDGSDTVVLVDNQTRSIQGLTTLTFRRGGTTTDTNFVVNVDVSFDPVSGAVSILDTATTRSATNVPLSGIPAASSARGDTLTASYYLSAPRFWWTKNEEGRTRFGWDGTTQKWAPYKGGSPKDLGVLSSSATAGSSLSPRPTTPIGSYLPGSSVGDAYAMIRLGTNPDSGSYPVVYRSSGPFSGVLVVSDDLATTSYNFASTTPPLAGVIGQGSGQIIWNPNFVQAHEGSQIWYSPIDFLPEASGIVGDLVSPHLFLSPTPGPGERPIIRLGNRAPLTVIPVATETLLASTSVSSGSVAFALSTGKLKFNAGDVAKADPGTRAIPNPSFDPLYLGVTVHYDGVTGNLYPQPVRAPCSLVDSSGSITPYSGQDLYIPDSIELPGLGVSGVLQVPDGSGTVPDPLAIVSPRPGASGLVRRLSPGYGDTILFAKGVAVARIVVVDFEDELPTDPYSLPAGTAYVSLQKHSPSTGSKVIFGADVALAVMGQEVRFLQADFIPCGYSNDRQLISVKAEPFTLDGTEVLSFRLGGTTVTWSGASLGAGTYSASTIATSITGSIGIAPGTCTASGGHLVLRGNTQVAIGFGTGGTRNLSGCTALGFLPGWSANAAGDQSATDPNWNANTGLGFGLYRSPNNLDGSQSIPDFRDLYRVTGATLSGSLPPTPYQYLTAPPREDIAGYSLGVYFSLSSPGAPGTSPVIDLPLNPYQNVWYQFDQKRFSWLSRGSFTGNVEKPITAIDFGVTSVSPPTLYAALRGSLKVSETGGAYQYLELGTDFLLSGGSATLVSTLGPKIIQGAQGRFSSGSSTFTDTTASFAGTVNTGDRLKVLTGSAQGSYTVTAVGATTLTVSPGFLHGDGGVNIGWEVFQGVSPGSIDPSVLADVTYGDFNTLPTEPFVVKVFTRLGISGGTLSDAALSQALASGRTLSARFSRDGLDIPLTLLGTKVLGTAANGSLYVPTLAPRFATRSFTITIGTRTLVQNVDLIPVASFSPDPGGTVEYLTTTGELKFGTTILSNYQGATVVYVETTLPGGSISTGVGEVDPRTGQVGLSAADIAAHLGETVYFVEQLVANTDVTLNPILGSFTFTQPVLAGQLVEVGYYRAVAGSGDKLRVNGSAVYVTEFLPVFIRREVATRVSDQVYTFNGLNRTVDNTVPPQVYAGEKLTSYGVPAGSTIDFTGSSISFVTPVSSGTRVTISYAVLEAVGGETTYLVSQSPVWRPPFNLSKGQTTFTLGGDRTSEVARGKVLRVGTFLSYISSVSYSPATQETTVVVYPGPTSGVGTLNPGAQAEVYLSDRPVTTSVDGVSVPSVDAGFLPTLADLYGLSTTPKFDPVTQGSTQITFEGDLTKYGVTGHLLEIFGRPFTVAKTSLSEDGRHTVFTVGSPFPAAFGWSNVLPNSKVKLSSRPIYPLGAGVFLGPGAIVESQGYELVLYGEKNVSGQSLPGRTLSLGKDFTLDPGTGNVSFLTPTQTGLGANQSLKFYRTDLTSLSPFLHNGLVTYPRVGATFGYIDPPSLSNGRLGGVLKATYTYESPDCFYHQVTDLTTYAQTVALNLAQSAAASNPGKGPVVTTGTAQKNDTQGSTGLASEIHDLVSKDRVARAYLGYFNQAVTAFEQTLETLNGDLVGDRDGKLRFWLGVGNTQWTTPGQTDPITGSLNPRNLWFEVWVGARSGLPPIRLQDKDPVISPLGAITDANGRPLGDYQDPSSFGYLLGVQRQLIKNDIDDVVLTGRERISRSLSGFITFKVTGYGNYQPLSKPSVFSRLFPERTETFTTTGPGIGADPTTGTPGVYSSGKLSVRVFGPGSPSVDYQSTTGTPIGRLENPVLGVVTNVLGVTAKDRLARARIWGYSRSGYSTIDPATTDRPSFLAVIPPLTAIPTVTETGLPDVTKFASQSGGPIPTGLPDIATGDPSLHTPPFRAGDQVALGRPDGTILSLGFTGSFFPVADTVRYSGVFVDQVYSGCVVTLKGCISDGSFVPIVNPDTLVILTGDSTSIPLTVSPGDTLLVTPNTGSSFIASDPPTTAEFQKFTAGLPTYRTGVDIDFSARTGDLLDATLPSFSDPTFFGLKELTGQRPPAPLSTLDATVTFQNGSITPVTIPALSGGKTLDNGDYSNPYTQAKYTELGLLSQAQFGGSTLLYGDSPTMVPIAPPTVDPYALEALYPDEILANNGVVSNSDTATPAALLTTADLTPASAVYPIPAHSGVGSLKPYDVVLVEEGSGVGTPGGSTGVLTVGSVTFGTPSVIEPPRFVSMTNPATAVDFSLENLQTWRSLGNTSGVVVTEDTTVPGVVTTTFDFSSIPSVSLVLDDGSGGGLLPVPVGGYNDFLSTCATGTKLYIKVVQWDGHFHTLSTVVITNTATGPDILTSGFVVSGDNDITQIPVNLGGLFFQPQVLVVTTTAPFFGFAAYDPNTPAPGITVTSGFHDVALTVSGLGSTSAGISSDRLTFTLPIDTRTATPRGTTTQGGDPMETSLFVNDVTIYLFDPTALSWVQGTADFNNTGAGNNGLAFTFLPRSTIAFSLYGVGWFDTGRGGVKVMAFEGKGNTPIDATGLTFSALTTARQTETDPIFNGLVISDEVYNPPAPSPHGNIFVPVSLLAGDPQYILPGDILTVQNVTNNPADTIPIGSGKAGTYLIRDVISANTTMDDRQATFSTSAGDGNGWLGLTFPTLQSLISGATLDLTVSGIQDLPVTETFGGIPVTATKVFRPTGRVFLILNEGLLSSSVAATYAGAVYSAAYASISGDTFVDLTDYRDGIGNPILQATFIAAASVGLKISGMTLAPVKPQGSGIPGNFPGYTNGAAALGSRSFYGFRNVTGTRGGLSLTYEANSGGDLSSMPAGTLISIYTKPKVPSTSFLPLETPVYDGIPGALDLNTFDWDVIHTTGAFAPAGTRCLLPGDGWSLDYSAQAGIYVEPSFPRSCNDLTRATPNVVDAGNSLTASEVGARRLGDYLTSPAIVPPGGSLIEFCQVEVRRPRRWHVVNDSVTSALGNLRFAYEIRRGIVSTVNTAAGVCTLTADPVNNHHYPSPVLGGTATQLGDFTDTSLGLNPGDVVRFLSPTTKSLLGEAEVTVLQGPLTLTLNPPGLVIPPGSLFEIFLRVPPVPQEQSSEELFSLAVDTLVVNRTADYTAQTGGQVTYLPDADPQVAYDQSVNKLTDTSGSIFSSVKPGDWLVVDPAGNLEGPTGPATPPEAGKNAYGDDGVLVRGADYTAGGPLRVDDNRGYYRVSTVSPTQVTVTASGNLLAGDRTTGDIVFGTSTGYAVYPTVHGSELSGSGDGLEGQMDLRPTAFAGVGNSYLGTWRSVAPFSYRIFRPSNFLTPETVELILSSRERILTWIEKLELATISNHGGTYYIFQRDQQVQDLGLTTDPGSGLGVFHNSLIFDIFGRVLVAPYINNTQCLSVLDRRFWGLDTRLDTLHPPYGSTTPYTDFSHGVARPVLPDRINVALTQRDKLRQIRNSWVNFRCNRSAGTLEAITRVQKEQPERRDSQEMKLLALTSMEKNL